MNEYYFEIDEDNLSQRIDIFLNSNIKDLTRTRIKKLIDDEDILVNSKKTKSSYKTRLNDQVIVKIPELKKLSTEPQNIPINIVYEDNDFIIINKQKGLVVHPSEGTKDGTLVNALLYHCDSLSGIGGVIRPGIVHRIDKDTTGLLMVAKNDKAHQSLSKQIQEKTAKRFYKAICVGNIKEDSGVINQPIGRSKKDRKQMAVVEDGREAITYWKVVERFGDYNLLELELKTGRTHQIRVHLAYIKHSIVGDKTYGPSKLKGISMKFSGQLLHAYKLILNHPTTNEKMEFLAEESSDIKKLSNLLRNRM